MDFVSFLGRLHPVVLHLPIGALFTILVAEIWLRRSRRSKDQSLLLGLYLFASITCLMAIATGLILHNEDAYGGSTLDLHEKLGIATGVATLIVTVFALFALQAASRDLAGNLWINLRRYGMFASVVLITITGHYGGELTHGKGFLWEHGPEFLQEKSEVEPIEITVETTAFEAAIYPIIDSYCVYCHDDETTKGKLRMDTPEFMLAGGSSGPLFIAGDIENSLMLQRVNLPMDDEEHMPPKEKRQPSEEAIAALVWWIGSGASFELKLNDPEVPEFVRALVQSGEETGETSVIAGELDLAAIQSLRDQLLTVQRIQQGDKRLWINFSAIATTAGDEFMPQLQPIADFIVWLDLSRTQITDASMPVIASMKHIQKLSLIACNITDTGLAQLSGLNDLIQLNLTQTNVTDASTPVIEQMESLETVHLFQSQFTQEGIEQLRAARPDLTVNFGD